MEFILRCWRRRATRGPSRPRWRRRRRVEEFGDPGRVVEDTLDYFRAGRRRAESDQLLARSRRGERSGGEREEVDLLRQLQERAKRADLHRQTGS